MKRIDFGTMKKHMEPVANGAVERTDEDSDIDVVGKGKVIDLLILVLIGLCVWAMLYTGGILEGNGIVESFANCDSSLSLVLGTFFTLIFTFILYIPRKIMSFKDFCDSFSEGVKSMVPAIMILILAWTLSGVSSGDYLDIGKFIGGVVGNNLSFIAFLPLVLFLIAIGLSIATGTSWGRILI